MSINQTQIIAYYKFLQLSDEIKAANGITAKTPRFDCTEKAGNYEPLESLKNKAGILFCYLSETRGIIDSPTKRRADRFLHTSASLNITSLFLFPQPVAGLGFVGFGNPLKEPTYGKGKKKKQNPFYNYSKDGFLFVVSPDWQQIEMLVLRNCLYTIEGNAKLLADGFYNGDLQAFRVAAQPFYLYKTESNQQ